MEDRTESIEELLRWVVSVDRRLVLMEGHNHSQGFGCCPWDQQVNTEHQPRIIGWEIFLVIFKNIQPGQLDEFTYVTIDLSTMKFDRVKEQFLMME